MTPTGRPQVLNLTPHTIRIIIGEATLSVPPSGPLARIVLAPDVPDGTVTIEGHQVPIVRTAATPEVTCLPEPRQDVLLIVARAVAEALPDRQDLVYPHDTVRDDRGAVIGCRSLGRPASAGP